MFQTKSTEPIAIVSSSCRFAGSINTPSELWTVLSNPVNFSQPVPRSRFAADAFYHRDDTYHGTTNSVRGYWLDQDHRRFDAGFFHITPKEAEAMDPQQRLVLEVVYEAMLSAGYPMSQYAGQDVAVFAGVMTADYDTLSQRDELQTSQYYATGNARSIIANRVSYIFDFRGPSMTIDTACSSSLVALHQAVQSLRCGESVMACVTGVNLMLTPEQFVVESDMHMLSPSGRCHMWDSRADGYARGEGVAAVLLKTLSQAIADGDKIHGIIRETGVNSDGRTEGITMPSSAAQTKLIQSTYRRAGLDPRTAEDRCQYFEAHGTGTAAGDPREAAAIHEAFFGGDATEDGEKLLVGSIKTVIGHTEGAAGLAGLLKVVEAMKNGQVAPNLHMENPSAGVRPYLNHLAVPTRLVAWPQPSRGQPKRASVNSFGFGGTNAHAIVEAYEDTQKEEEKEEEEQEAALSLSSAVVGKAVPLCISAASPRALHAVARSLRDFLGHNPACSVQHLASILVSARDALPFRQTLTVANRHEALTALDALIHTNNTSSTTLTSARVAAMDGPPQLLGIFTGQGAQWPTVARSLLRSNTLFQSSIAKLDAVLAACDDPPAWTLASQIEAEAKESRIHEAAIAQPLCTAVQIALVDLLQSLHITFHTVIGHSSGEIAAAYAAGRLTIRDAMLIAYYRGLVISQSQSRPGQPQGGMLAAGLSEKDALGFCRDTKYAGRLFVAAGNAPALSTISGDLDMIKQAKLDLDQQQVMAKVLHVDAAYHSPRMAAAAAAYMKALEKCQISPMPDGNGMIWVSSVYGFQRSSEKDLGASYWRDNMLCTVQFHDAVDYAFSEFGPYDCAVEVGAHAALRVPVCQTASACGLELPYCGMLDRSKDDSIALSDFLGFIWSTLGSLEEQLPQYLDNPPNSATISSYLQRLPLYPWDHSQIHYRESRLCRRHHFRHAPPHELLGVRSREDDEHNMRWRNILKLDKIPWLEHHVFQGQPLLPASAYCVMALDAVQCLPTRQSPTRIELCDLEIICGVVIDRAPHGTEIAFSVTASPDAQSSKSHAEASFSLTSCPADGTSELKLNMTGKARLFFDINDGNALPPRQQPKSENLPADSCAFYSMMRGVGLAYTGPFRAIQSIRRRHRYCAASLPSHHEDDTTSLTISPATLDCCFQTAFLTYSSPGDGALWGPLLPSRIGRIQFDTKACGYNSTVQLSRQLDTDAFLTHASPADECRPATFTVDINVSDTQGIKAIQVEGLVVRSIPALDSRTRSTSFLDTVMDHDPRYEIVGMEAEDYSDLPEEFADRPSTIAFPDYSEGGSAASLPQKRPRTTKTTASGTAKHASRFYRHIGRIAQQIAHYQPRMKCLCLPDGHTGLPPSILAGLNNVFQSFTIATTSESDEAVYLREVGLSLRTDLVSFDKENYLQLANCPKNDLIIVAVSLLEDREPLDMLEKIATLMNPEGFLILFQAHRPVSPLGYGASRPGHLTPPHWPDALAYHGFHSFAKNSDQTYPSGCTVMLRQLAPVESIPAALPLERSKVLFTENLLVIGSKHGVLEDSWEHLLARLSRRCVTSTARNVLDDVEPAILQACTAVIIISDEESPLDSLMAHHNLDSFRALFRPNMTMLWVIQNSRHGAPGHAAVLGFTRTITAEVPNLKLQVLDLCKTPSPETHIVDVFLRLCTGNGMSDGRGRLLTREPEIYIEGGRRLIPRVKILDKINNRAMAFRRPLTETVDSAREAVQIVRRVTLNGQSEMAARFANETAAASKQPNRATIVIDYSSVQPIRFDSEHSLYTCIGIDAATGRSIIGLTAFNSSIINADSLVHHYTLPSAFETSSCFLRLVNRCLVAQLVSLRSSHNNVLLVNADGPLERELTKLASGRDQRMHFYTATPSAKSSHENVSAHKYLHPASSSRHIRDSILMQDRNLTIYDFTDPRTELAKRFQESIPEGHVYHQAWSSLFAEDPTLYELHEGTPFTSEIWNSTVAQCLMQLEQESGCESTANNDDEETLSLSRLPTWSPSIDPFQVLDWKSERSVKVAVNPTIEPNLFKPNKTYILIGLTRDLGQSLCRLFIEHGARHIVLASRNPTLDPAWIIELSNDSETRILVEKLDVTDVDQVTSLKHRLRERSMPPVGGLINGAMVLEDRTFAQMTSETWARVMRPKTVGSSNLDKTFWEDDIEFFIMTSSFAAIGGHPGQSNYAAANMYMNGLAANRRSRGLAGSVLNIGVIYGLGFLHREKGELYAGLEREGYPPISEHDVHHMVLESIVAGRPGGSGNAFGDHQPYDIIAGLSHFRVDDPNPLHWHLDPRFSHLSIIEDSTSQQDFASVSQLSLKEQMAEVMTTKEMTKLILDAFMERLGCLLQISSSSGQLCKESRLSELGVDSLLAVDIRNWAAKKLGVDVAVMKIMGSSSVYKLCCDMAEVVLSQ